MSDDTRDSTPQAIVDRLAIIDTMSHYASGIDQRDRALYGSCFADPLEVDLGAGTETQSADTWVERAFTAVSAFQVTQHIITNHAIELDGDEAKCTAYLQAMHWNPTNSLLVGGTYKNHLVRDGRFWRISRLVLEIVWSQTTQSEP